VCDKPSLFKTLLRNFGEHAKMFCQLLYLTSESISPTDIGGNRSVLIATADDSGAPARAIDAVHVECHSQVQFV
jgi:hypothetical protein